MFENFTPSSIPSLKRPCTDTETDLMQKKSKVEFVEIDDLVKKEYESEPLERLGTKCDKATKLVALILNGRKRNVQIYPSQIVWCRSEKSPFWPAMVWPTKYGRITDERQRIHVKLFAKKNASVWMKLVNVFPFDGLESFEQMKKSIDVTVITTTMKRDFDFAFNITNELWPRAVAEAIYCMDKDREERLALLLAFSSSFELRKRQNNPLQRRSLEPNVSKNLSLVKTFRVDDEINRVQSFVKDVSFPKVETSTNSEEIQNYEKMLLEFVTESHASSKFNNNVDKICNICFSSKSTGKLIKCSGSCDGFLHQECYENRAPQRLRNRDSPGESNQLICIDCAEEMKDFCFICKTDEDASKSEMVNCKAPSCFRRYHENCLKNWPQVKWTGSNEDLNLICPLHECHQCASNVKELTTCIKCPTALHNVASCIHAGMIILSDLHHICIKHRQHQPTISNLDYCYICKMGCNLLRCQTCPHSYHELCMPSTLASTSTCAKCFRGQHPLYGDIIWAKLYTYAWWPAIIVPPQCIPHEIRIVDHSAHDVCLCFFGDHTFSWIDRQSLHQFDEDNFVLFTENSQKFSRAISSARKWLSQAKDIKMKKLTEFVSSTSTSLDDVTPPPYTNISENIPIAPAALFLDPNNEASPCRCDTDDQCGVSSHCLNRASCTECNDLCLSPNCGNKCIQQGKYPKVHLKYFERKGFGLMSSEWIPFGTIVQQYTGEIITSSEFERRMQNKMRSNDYFMRYTKDLFIDGELKGSLARFINHSCDPNSSFRLWSVNGENVVVVIAMQDIPKDTEITCKYDWSRNIPCLCNADNCHGFC